MVYVNSAKKFLVDNLRQLSICMNKSKINEKSDCLVCEHTNSWHRKTTSGRICDFLGCACVLEN